MKLHRFYVGGLHDKRGALRLEHHVWVHDKELLNQWLKVLRLRIGDQIVLFTGPEDERLYKVGLIEPATVGLDLVTQLEPQRPKREIYLFWSLLKKDNNDHILQKATELGASHFIPLLAERTAKTGFDSMRATRIVIEAAEQCGRSDIPAVRDPITPQTAVQEYSDKINLVVCDQNTEDKNIPNGMANKPLGLLIGPEGGWSEDEKELFQKHGLPHINIGQFTLRAETAAVTAISQLIQ